MVFDALRIALLAPGAPSTVSGGYLYNAYLAQELRRLGHTVDAYDTTLWRGRIPAETARAQVWLEDGLGASSYLELATAHEVKAARVALIHVPGALLQRPHSPSKACPREHAYLRSVHGAVFVSRQTLVDARSLYGDFGCAGGATVVVEPGFDHVCLPDTSLAPQKKQRGFHIITVAHLLPNKGYDRLMQGLVRFAEQARRVPDCPWHATLIGQESDHNTAVLVDAMVARYRLPVRRVGKLSADDVFTHVAKADVFVQASHYESFGMAAVEAMRLGVPVVSCTRGGPRSWLEHSCNGLWACGQNQASDSDVAEALAAALCRLHGTPELQAKLRLGAASTPVCTRTWAQCATEVSKLLLRTVRTHSQGVRVRTTEGL